MIKRLKIEARLSKVTGGEAAGACERQRKGKSPKAMAGNHPPGCFWEYHGNCHHIPYDGALSVLPPQKRGYPEQYYYIGLVTGFQPVFLLPCYPILFLLSGGFNP